MDAVGLAARITELSDAALEDLVRERHVPAQLATVLDVAEHLLSETSISLALQRRTAAELEALARGASNERLDALCLGDRGIALPQVREIVSVADTASAWSPSASRPRADAALTALDYTTKLTELAHRIADKPIVLRSRAQLPAATSRVLAAVIDVDPAQLDEHVELLVLAGVVAEQDGRLLATVDADSWLERSIPDRWLRIATAWLRAHPDAAAIVSSDLGTAFPRASTTDLVELARTARQAGALGLAAEGALTQLADAALDTPSEAVAALSAHVPESTETLYVQPDLSIVAPGPLTSQVELSLRRVAELEHAGIASQWRLTPQSISRGLARGESEASIAEFLEAASLTSVAQPVRYLLRDAAARFGSLRVRPIASGDVRAEARASDAKLLRTLAVDRALAGTGVAADGDARVTFRVSAEEAVEALQEERYPAVLEDADGSLVTRPAERARPRAAEPHRLVARLRGSGFDVGDGQRAWLERQLSEAVRERLPVRLTVTLAAEPTDVDVVPLAVAHGRLRARDPQRDVERTLPLSAITRVAGLGVAS